MLNWAKISSDVEYALTLEGTSLDTYLATLSDTPEDTQIRRLLLNLRANSSFMATSTTEDAEPFDVLPSKTVIDIWEIESLIGRGGMGDVYLANRADGLYEQKVALKLMQGLSKQRQQQFDIERRRLALMNHPGIARIIDGGSNEFGRPYIVMEHVDGLSIDQYVQVHKLNEKQILRLFVSVCKAVEHAHAQLILHKDIKALNVLVDNEGQTRLIDFGIASELAGEETENNAFSLASAAPEQLKGEAVSVQTDVFALGILLYQLLSGQLPKRKENAGVQIDLAVVSKPDLMAIIQKSLSLDVSERYGSVSALCEDLLAYISGLPVTARQGGIGYRMSKFIQRYPLASSFAFIAVISLGAGLATSINYAQEANAEAQRAKQALDKAQQNLERAQFFLTRADIFHATQSAYADTLQSLFGADADVEKQTRILKERWAQAYELRAEDPNNSAFLSYAIGRHFVFRNDYLTAIDILQPWVTESYGPEELLGYARQLLAIAYNAVGRKDDALPLLKQTRAWLGESFDAGSPDHIASATQVALITHEQEDILLAESLLLKGLEDTVSDPIKMYFWNQTSTMRQMRGDFSSAYTAMKEVVQIIDSKPLMEISGTDTGLLNLANFELYYTKNSDNARELAKRVIQTAKNKKGSKSGSCRKRAGSLEADRRC